MVSFLFAFLQKIEGYFSVAAEINAAQFLLIFAIAYFFQRLCFLLRRRNGAVSA